MPESPRPEAGRSSPGTRPQPYGEACRRCPLSPTANVRVLVKNDGVGVLCLVEVVDRALNRSTPKISCAAYPATAAAAYVRRGMVEPMGLCPRAAHRRVAPFPFVCESRRLPRTPTDRTGGPDHAFCQNIAETLPGTPDLSGPVRLMALVVPVRRALETVRVVPVDDAALIQLPYAKAMRPPVPMVFVPRSSQKSDRPRMVASMGGAVYRRAEDPAGIRIRGPRWQAPA